MNNERRKRLTALVEQIGLLKDSIQEVLDEEQEAFDNMSKRLQPGEKGFAIVQATSAMGSAILNLEGAEFDLLEAVK